MDLCKGVKGSHKSKTTISRCQCHQNSEQKVEGVNRWTGQAGSDGRRVERRNQDGKDR